MKNIAISADKGIPKMLLDQLAKQTSLPLLSPKITADYRLHLTLEHLELRKIIQTGKKQKTESITVDFVGGKTNHRRLHGGGKGQDIAKAVGLHKIKNPSILDLTAGMGGDAFVLASLGAHVTMLERNPVIHALLKDALDRTQLINNQELHEIIDRLTLINHDSLAFLDDFSTQQMDDFPDVIYIDPMFPSRSKSAQVKKEMQFFHDIVGADQDSEALLIKAISIAKKRIVVKRPRLAETLSNEIQAAFIIQGKSTRYDVYLPLSNSKKATR